MQIMHDILLSAREGKSSQNRLHMKTDLVNLSPKESRKTSSALGVASTPQFPVTHTHLLPPLAKKAVLEKMG